MGLWHIVRHGETDWNRAGRIQGHADASLNSRGRHQAELLRRRLASCAFDAVYASDLTRATKTAEGIIAGRSLSVRTVTELREFSYGDWEGRTMAEVEERQPGTIAERIGKGHNAFAAPGGENTEQIVDRVRRVSTDIIERHATDTILIVAHGGSIRALLVCLLGLPADSFWRFHVACASLSVIAVDSGGSAVHLWNDTSHLAGEDAV